MLVLGGTAAADERTPTLDVEGAAALVIPHAPGPDVSSEDPAAFGMVRAMLAWDEPPAEMPAQRGYAWRGSISPEIGVGLLDHEGQGDGLVEAGLRLHLSFAQREMGLFRVSAKGGMWMAGRGGIVGNDHTPMAEVSVGWYLWLGSSWRVGWEVGGVALRNDRADGHDPVGPPRGQRPRPRPLRDVRRRQALTPPGQCGPTARTAASASRPGTAWRKKIFRIAVAPPTTPATETQPVKKISQVVGLDRAAAEPAGADREAPGQAGGEEAVVQALVDGHRRGQLGLGRGELERAVPGRGVSTGTSP